MSAGMPMPVSRTEKRSTASSSVSDTRLDPHGDLALVGELDGVAHQVDEDLAQPAGVAAQTAPARPDATAQMNSSPFSWARTASSGGDVVQQCAQVEVQRLQLELARLDLGEVEDVVDDRQQRLAARAHGLGVAPLLLVQLGVQQQPGHADDAVHGRADLVAHVGQELALGDVGRLGSRVIWFARLMEASRWMLVRSSFSIAWHKPSSAAACRTTKETALLSRPAWRLPRPKWGG